MASLLQEFTEIVTAFNEVKLEYAICGGWALAIHGYPRATIDIDMLIQPNDLDLAITEARKRAYHIDGLPLSLKGGQIEIRRISKVDPETNELFTLDFLLVTPTLSDIWKQRETIVIDGNPVTVVSKQGLVKLKTISDRPQDRADIARMSDES